MDLFRYMGYFFLHDIVNLYEKSVHLFVVFSTVAGLMLMRFFNVCRPLVAE